MNDRADRRRRERLRLSVDEIWVHDWATDGIGRLESMLSDRTGPLPPANAADPTPRNEVPPANDPPSGR